jgi:hypothetical protein
MLDIEKIAHVATIIGLPVIVVQIFLAEDAFQEATEYQFRSEMLEFFVSFDQAAEYDRLLLQLDGRLEIGQFLSDERAIDRRYWRQFTSSLCDSLESAICASASQRQYPFIVLDGFPNILAQCYPHANQQTRICN